MFSRLVEPAGAQRGMWDQFMPQMQPTPQEMKDEAEAAQFNRTVRVTGVTVKTFDLSVPEQVAQYEEVVAMLFRGVQARTHLILFNERRFVSDGTPRWIAHAEWAEFELEVTAVQPVGGAHADDGEASH